jgi:hypothetical protein
MMAWTWRLESGDGSEVVQGLEVPDFPSQSDAESWLGEVWRDLVAAGAAAATLVEDGRVVYGPMSLENE